MSTMVTMFLDRLVERIAALLAGMVGSRIESLHAEVEADQRSRLEDLARKYEADGKIQIAELLRQRVVQMSSIDLAAEGKRVLDQLTGDGNSQTAPARPQRVDALRTLPNMAEGSGSTSTKRRKTVAIPLPPVASPLSSENKGVVS